VHPSSILRSRDEATRRQEMERFIADLKRTTEALAKSPLPVGAKVRRAATHSL
jgi:hypothetical protein